MYVPETSQPEPPDITSVEYLPLFFTEICSAHTRSLFGFLIDKFTSLELEDTPLMDIRSFWPYEDKSVWRDNCNLVSDFISSSENELVLSENEINDIITYTIKSSAANSIKDMGKVITLIKDEYNGKMDFGAVSKIIKEKLLNL